MPDGSATDLNLQKAKGVARVGIGPQGRLSELFQQGCAKVMLPKTHGAGPQAVFINTAGGLTGGDNLRFEVAVAAAAKATATTQTAERIYRSLGRAATVRNTLVIGAGGHLDWLPQETIVFEGGVLTRDLDVTLHGDASATLLESLVLGRAAMGETVDRVSLTDHWRIRRAERLIHGESLRLGPTISGLRHDPAALAGARAVATLVHLGPDAEIRLDALRDLPGHAGVTRGSSAWDGKLVTRFLAPDGQPLRRALGDILTWMRGSALPRVWTI